MAFSIIFALNLGLASRFVMTTSEPMTSRAATRARAHFLLALVNPVFLLLGTLLTFSWQT